MTLHDKKVNKYFKPLDRKIFFLNNFLPMVKTPIFLKMPKPPMIPNHKKKIERHRSNERALSSCSRNPKISRYPVIQGKINIKSIKYSVGVIKYWILMRFATNNIIACRIHPSVKIVPKIVLAIIRFLSPVALLVAAVKSPK